MREMLYTQRVAFGDCDPARIVWFPNFFRWIDAASRHFFIECGVPDWVETEKRWGVIGTPLVDTHAKFMKTASYGDVLEIHVSIAEWRGKSFVQRYRITRAGDPIMECEEVRIFAAHKEDGSPVCVGTASIGPSHGETELTARLARFEDPGELFVVDQLEVGMKGQTTVTSLTRGERNGGGYPFSLDEKLERITEPHPWYTAAGGKDSPWGRAIVPFEMISVLAHKTGGGFPVRGPVMGLFLDLEIRLLDGPVFVDQAYSMDREIVGLGQSRRTESYWTRTTLTDVDTGRAVAQVLLHSGVFKESFAGYPKDRLGT